MKVLYAIVSAEGECLYVANPKESFGWNAEWPRNARVVEIPVHMIERATKKRCSCGCEEFE